MSAPNDYPGNRGNDQPQRYPGNGAPMPYPQQSQVPQPQYSAPYPNGPQPMPPQGNGPWTGGGAPAAAPWYKRWTFWLIAVIAVALVGVLIWLIVAASGSKDADDEQSNQSQTQSQQNDRTTTDEQQGTNNSGKTDGDITEDNDSFECDANGYCRIKNFGKTGVPEIDGLTDDSSRMDSSDTTTGNDRTSNDVYSFDTMEEKMTQALNSGDAGIYTAYMDGLYEQFGVSKADRLALEDLGERLVEDLIKLKTESDRSVRKDINDDFDLTQDRIDEILDKY